MIPSIVDWPVPYRLSNRCFVFASLTAMIGKPSLPSASSAFSRITPVVVSSVPAMMSPSCSRRAECSTPITSAPSSIVRCGLWSTAASMCE